MTTETVKVAETLLPHIRRMSTRKHANLGTASSIEEARISKWVAWGLKRLNKAVSRANGEFVVPPEIVPERISIQTPSSAPESNV